MRKYDVVVLEVKTFKIWNKEHVEHRPAQVNSSKVEPQQRAAEEN